MRAKVSQGRLWKTYCCLRKSMTNWCAGLVSIEMATETQTNDVRAAVRRLDVWQRCTECTCNTKARKTKARKTKDRRIRAVLTA